MAKRYTRLSAPPTFCDLAQVDINPAEQGEVLLASPDTYGAHVVVLTSQKFESSSDHGGKHEQFLSVDQATASALPPSLPRICLTISTRVRKGLVHLLSRQEDAKATMT